MVLAGQLCGPRLRRSTLTGSCDRVPLPFSSYRAHSLTTSHRTTPLFHLPLVFTVSLATSLDATAAYLFSPAPLSTLYSMQYTSFTAHSLSPPHPHLLTHTQYVTQSRSHANSRRTSRFIPYREPRGRAEDPFQVRPHFSPFSHSLGLHTVWIWVIGST